MKNNLKNRPKPYEKGLMPYIPLDSEWKQYLRKLDEWFEGFERELRKIAYEDEVHVKWIFIKLKEILGE